MKNFLMTTELEKAQWMIHVHYEHLVAFEMLQRDLKERVEPEVLETLIEHIQKIVHLIDSYIELYKKYQLKIEKVCAKVLRRAKKHGQ